MNSQSLEEAAKALHVSQDLEKVTPEHEVGPLQAVEQSLSTFLVHRLRKLQEDTDFEQKVKNALEARIPEADINQLMQLLAVVQSNNNTGVEKVLTPFLNNKAVALDSSKKNDVEEQIFRGASRELLQSFEELNRLVTEISRAKTNPAEEIKEALVTPVPTP